MEEQRQDRINRILELYFSRIAPNGVPAELETSVREWFAQGSYVEEKYAALENAFEKHITYNPEPSEEAFRSWIETMHRLGMPISDELMKSVRLRPLRTVRLKRVALRAAAVALPLLLAVGFYFLNGVLSADGGLVAESVPAGVSLREVALPDGSRVWLKTGSTIEFADGFARQRRVALSGEAFFDVAHDGGRAFIVDAGDVTVRVTGTGFNVDARPGQENIKVTLYEGSVKVKTDGRWTQIEPGQQLGYNAGTGESAVRRVDLDANDWRNRGLSFVDAGLTEIFKAVSQAYGIPFECNITDSGEKYMASFAPGEELRVVLTVLRSITGEFDFEITSEKVIINKPR